MPTQNISMTEELAQFVSQQVGTGDYASVSEVYREALRRFRDQEEEKKIHLSRLKQELEKGLEDSKAGRVQAVNSAEEHQEFYQSIEERALANQANA